MPSDTRTPVAVAVNETSHTIVVVCDDGTVWVHLQDRPWVQEGSAIPGTLADKSGR